jgi:hypothetical protein
VVLILVLKNGNTFKQLFYLDITSLSSFHFFIFFTITHITNFKKFNGLRSGKIKTVASNISQGIDGIVKWKNSYIVSWISRILVIDNKNSYKTLFESGMRLT